MRKRSSTQVFRITGARKGLEADVRGRQRRYVISMSVRTVSVILAAVLWNVERPVAIVALVLGATLPYIAVVIANAGRENAPSLPSTFVSMPPRPMLASSHQDAAADDDADRDDYADHAESVPEDAAAGARREPRERT
ncbi:DUF3099 domain-containing protein [Streptomyces cavernae]|uniref:DUF3099 domain-containing protein n=1 Tax=Streptomyces cavernae TaxID=2259034 RepID=UPI00192E6338|nr:DUF3099 domain-containing protein [Streptomyces cavernae]